MTAPLRDYREALLRAYGSPRARSDGAPFERVAAAVLGRNGAEALRTLRIFGLLDARKLRETDATTVAMAIQSAGRAAAKAVRLKGVADWFLRRFEGDADRAPAASVDRLREELLEVKGVGPETADAILLTALELPTFVVDAHAYRILTRHGLALEDATYGDLKESLERGLPRDAAAYREFHALIGAVGRQYCRPKARCEDCPLRPFLPAGSEPGGARPVQ